MTSKKDKSLMEQSAIQAEKSLKATNLISRLVNTTTLHRSSIDRCNRILARVETHEKIKELEPAISVLGIAILDDFKESASEVNRLNERLQAMKNYELPIKEGDKTVQLSSVNLSSELLDNSWVVANYETLNTYESEVRKIYIHATDIIATALHKLTFITSLPYTKAYAILK